MSLGFKPQPRFGAALPRTPLLRLPLDSPAPEASPLPPGRGADKRDRKALWPSAGLDVKAGLGHPSLARLGVATKGEPGDTSDGLLAAAHGGPDAALYVIPIM